ncbi:NAD(P)/FAD-dependent oxidoreductase [Metapseudomonas resinovorans]|uniref:Putative monooxygenase n=1 Tax=Metapseudomonas resinovorans NBRC 106553 TaxID=1245471 RepID=S6ADF7_METRE|nr:NAD(P)/FAD-dependent oxidoreductase [Pseudomonas resinovorans]BAN47237.1 putative monooxygenase [Pseudomonas resinovorans NBRC 106553]
MPDYDVLIIGAGLSGVGLACHLATDSPTTRVGILERRQAVGGTWDLFRYPGIRSDADMFTFGYDFRPWHSLKTLADGPSIQKYIDDTAREHGVRQKIRFGIRTTSARWSSERQLWTVLAVDVDTGEPRSFTCRFLVSCTGYYSQDEGYLPEFPGRERYQGIFIHPQKWPEGLDYKGKRVLVIGSGATAVTLVPAMAEEAAHVTMLQRSPSYVITVPGEDKLTGLLRRILPAEWAYGFARHRNIWLQRAIFKASKRWPEQVRGLLLKGVRKQLGDSVDMRHFTPTYMPWDERLCAVPDGDLFKVLREGKASVVTDHIETFTETGIQLESGEHLDADIVIAATGLKLQVFGGTDLYLDEQKVAINERMTYKGVMSEGLPNVGFIFGYTNAPWTLKADLSSKYLCRLINHMRSHNLSVVVPQSPEGERQTASIMGDSMQSGYVQRGNAVLPRQGRSLPWRVTNDLKIDRDMLLNQPIEDTALSFRPA